MIARRRSGRVGGLLYALDLIAMFLRVAIVTTAWIALFLGTFFGYLTAPFLVLIGFVIVYAILDRFRVRARREAERRTRILDEPVREPIYVTTDWHFVITRSNGTAPATITVSWANGQTATVALQVVTGGTAHYRTTLNLNSAVTDATAAIALGWSRQFNVSSGPCLR